MHTKTGEWAPSVASVLIYTITDYTTTPLSALGS
jgi:hypothetical protein